jgi:hypothetical protein
MRQTISSSCGGTRRTSTSGVSGVFIPPGASLAKKLTLVVGALTNPTVGNIPPGDVTVAAGTITITGYTVSTAVLGSHEGGKVGLGPIFSDPTTAAFASAGYTVDTGFTSLTGLDASGAPATYSTGFILLFVQSMRGGLR